MRGTEQHNSEEDLYTLLQNGFAGPITIHNQQFHVAGDVGAATIEFLEHFLLSKDGFSHKMTR